MRHTRFLSALLLTAVLASPAASAPAFIDYLGDDSIDGTGDIATRGPGREVGHDPRRPGRPPISLPPSWEMLATSGARPSGRHVCSLVLDPRSRNAILFGGYGNGGVQGNLWALSMESGTWTFMDVPGGPSPRWAYMSVYDPYGKRMIVFGGARSPVPGHERSVNEVWALGLEGTPEWTQITPLGTPPSPRFAGVTVFDRRRNRVILFGGYDSTFRNDTWALELRGTPTWRLLAPAGATPRRRDAHAAVYDERFDRMIVFAGFDGTAGEDFMNDVWALDLSHPRWTELSLPGAPSPRREQACAYDARNHRMLLWGGGSPSDGLLDEVWQLALDRLPVWTKLAPAAGLGPSPRAGHAAAYDDRTQRLIGFGGYAAGGDEPDENDFVYSDKAWALQFTRRHRGSNESEAEAGAVDLGESGTLEAATALRVGITAARSTRDGLSIGFTLPGAEPARIEIFSVAGRPLASREVGALGAGRHEITLGGSAGMPPGVYFVRLGRSDVAVTRKVAVLW